ncbi:hypothetical protein FBU30_002814 [Linnemannia zychae]|nr:hypothetical protein FBU30_002814 [Linnemannia zychae]
MSCLEKWRAMAPRAESKFKCDTCHYEYSIYRTRTAKILGNIWFLRSISVLIVILITYGVAWIGRVLNNHAWQWKDQIFQVDSAMLRILGLDKLDVLFGLMGMAILGIVIMGTTYCIGAVLTTSTILEVK